MSEKVAGVFTFGPHSLTWMDSDGRCWHREGDGEPVELTEGPRFEHIHEMVATWYPSGAATGETR